MATVKGAYTSQELAPLLGITERSVQRRAISENWLSRPRLGRGGGNEWLLASMPEATRLKIAAALATALAKQSEPGKQPVNSPATLPASKRNRAEARALAVRMAGQYRMSGKLTRSTAYELFAHKYNSGEISAPDWVKTALPSLSRASLLNWEDALQKGGVAALADKYGSHRKGKGALDQQDIKEFCLGHIYRWPLKGASQIYKSLQARLELQSTPERLPSQRLIQIWYKRWRKENEELLTFITNPDAWRNKFRVSFGDADGLVWQLNQEWEMDSTPADLILADGKRHTIVACIDLFTRRVTFHVSRTSSSHAVATCLRKAITSWGVPETVRTDNGADYVSQHMERVFMDMQILPDVCDPFSPEQKPFVERVFRTFLHDTVELLDGFVGHNVAERKALEARKSFAQRMMEKKDRQTIELRLTPEELQEVCDRWANDTYMHRKHSSLGMSPYEKALSWDGPVRRVENEDALRLLFLPCADGDGTRTVSKKGIQIFNDDYFAPVLALHVGRRVQVRVDDADHRHVHVFNLDGTEFICTARGYKHSGMTEAELRGMSSAAKRLQVEQRGTGTAAMRSAAKAANLENIAYERMQADEIRARRIEAEQPLRAELMGIHSTPALEGAAEAAAPANYTPAPMSEAARQMQERAREAIERAQKPAAPAVNEKKERYLEARALEAALDNGQAVPEDKLRWLKNYQKTPEYDAQSKLERFNSEPELRVAAG